MINGVCEKFFLTVAKKCEGAAFSVFQKNDFAIEPEFLESMLENLSAIGFISVRFSSPEVFCIQILQDGWNFLSLRKPKRIPKKTKSAQQLKWIIFFNALASFFGAFFAVLLVR